MYWNRKHPSREEIDSLIHVLQQCRSLVSASDDYVWSGMEGSEILGVLDTALHALGNELKVNVTELKTLFAPTGALQETSLSNNWSEQYLDLASKFDGLITAWA